MRNLRNLAALTVFTAIAVQAAVVPRPAPDLAINLAPGKQVRLSQYRGKTVVLAFILTYCSHCQAVVRGLIKDQQELGPKGLQVVATAIEDTAATAIPGFLRLFTPPFPAGYNTNPEALQFLQHSPMLAFYMPGLAIIDKTGVIRAQFEGRDLPEGTQEKLIHDKILEVMNLSAPEPATHKPASGKKTAAKRN